MIAAETPILLLSVYSSLFLLSLQSHRCVANAKPYCTPSACGIISNISYPFRLKGDPNGDYCGDPGGELACENNVTFFYLNSHKYYVKELIYGTTMRLVDTSINNHTCSFPTYSASRFYDMGVKYHYFSGYSTPISFMSCQHPLKNSSTFTNTTHCQTSNSRFTYIKIGMMKASDVIETCRVDVTVLTSWEFKDLNKSVSLEEIHRSLLYGFYMDFCFGCGASSSTGTAWEKFADFFDRKLRSPFIYLLAIAVVIGAVVNPVIGVTIALGLLLSFLIWIYHAIRNDYPNFDLLDTIIGTLLI